MTWQVQWRWDGAEINFAIGRDVYTDELSVWPYIHAPWVGEGEWRYLEGDPCGRMRVAGRVRSLAGHNAVVVVRCVVHHKSSRQVYAVASKCVRWNAALAQSIVVTEKLDDGLSGSDAMQFAQQFIRDRLKPLIK